MVLKGMFGIALGRLVICYAVEFSARVFPDRLRNVGGNERNARPL